MLGPPGAGKGTQARWLGKELKTPHISTGLIFRDAMKAGTPLGLQAKALTDKGNLVPDEIVIGIVAERLAAEDCRERGFILDGFPRTLPQAMALDRWLSSHALALDRVIELSVDAETIVRRLSGRLLCNGCGKDYNIHFRRPRIDGICDYCAGSLTRRADDEPDAIRRRLEVDAEKTRPLHEYYLVQGSLVVMDGAGTIEEVFRSVLGELE